MTLKNSWNNPQLNHLKNQLIYLKVEGNSFTIRKANLDKASTFWNKKEEKEITYLKQDLNINELITESSDRDSMINVIGGKAANFLELKKIKNTSTPENSFAIPFYYYQQHLIDNNIDTVLKHFLHSSTFKSNLKYRKESLIKIQDLIIKAPLNKKLRSLVLKKIHSFKNFDSYKFRSSTNAEDTDNFTGAGLYNSFAAKKGSNKKSIDHAIKKVWASLWNMRAYEEREYSKINQESISMGILVHRSFPNEDANGVVVTKNLYNKNHGYMINVQYKDISTVRPNSNIVCDQIISYTINLIDNSCTYEYLTKSNIKNLKGNPVLTEKELRELSDIITNIKEYYYKIKRYNSKYTYNDFALDIEFKLDSQISKRKIYIKQVRIFN